MKTISRLGILFLAFVSHSSLAQDCAGPHVTFGEVMSGFQAGFTVGALVLNEDINGNPQPGGLFLSSSRIDVRGFIDAETGGGWLCSGDWGLTNLWFGVPILPNRIKREAKAFANGFILNVRMIVTDSDFESTQLEVAQTNAMLGILPSPFPPLLSAIVNIGAFLEPGLLDPGTYELTTFLSLDLDCLPADGVGWGEMCDGIPDDEDLQLGPPVIFEFLPND